MPVTVRLLDSAELDTILPLVQQLNPKLDEPTIRARLDEMRSTNYRCIGAFAGDDSDKKLVGICGVWTGTKLWCGKFIEADNVVVDSNHRSLGIGEKMMAFLHELGKQEGCDLAVLDTYVTYARAQKFYFGLGHDIRGFHFVREFERR